MWPFRNKEREPSILDQPRYKEKPALLLFEIYVLDVIGKLSPQKREGIQKLDINKIFNTKATHWKSALKEELQLSLTLETAILDRWYNAVEKNGGVFEGLDPEAFSREFADAYFAKNSDIDVWKAGTLEKAKKRIEEYKKKGM